MKNVSLSRLKRTVVDSIKAEGKGQSIALFDLDWVTQVFCFFATVYMSANDWESTANIDMGLTNKFQQVGEFENMEPTNNEEQLYFSQQGASRSSMNPVQLIL